MTHEKDTPDLRTIMPIVVGAHLQAEIQDRPLGARIRRVIRQWQMEHDQTPACVPLVCTDLWYLNAPELVERPTISVGDPAVNAASAWFANRLPTAFMIEHSFQVQLDPEFIHLQACVWGVDHAATRAGVDLFLERYLDPFLRTAHGIGQA